MHACCEHRQGPQCVNPWHAKAMLAATGKYLARQHVFADNMQLTFVNSLSY